MYSASLGILLLSLVLLVRYRWVPVNGITWGLGLSGLLASVPLGWWLDLRSLGLRLGQVRHWLPPILIGAAIALLGIVAIADTPAFRADYPYVPFTPQGLGLFTFREALEVIDMFGWEFFFRGVLLFALAARLGTVPAVLIQATLFACAHVGKPELEIYGSIFGGVFLGALCLRVRSFFPAFVAHELVFSSAEVAGVVGRWVS